jgi:N-acetyl sugar amidotransferase
MNYAKGDYEDTLRQVGRICKRCVMDETDKEITFDEDGFCNHCNSYFETSKRALKPLSGLEKIIDGIKKETQHSGRKYHGAIGISGGWDSSHVAYMIKNAYDLNVLLIHFDNGYDMPEGVNNVKAIVKHTGWDFVNNTCDFNEFRDLQLSYLKAGVRNIEALSDHGILANLYHTVEENDIKYIFKGNNWVTEGILPPSWGYRHRDLVNIKDIHGKHGELPLKTFPTISLPKIVWLEKIKGITNIAPLNYINYDYENVKKTLMVKWGFQDYYVKHGESLVTKFYQQYILPVRWNIDKRKAHLSTQVCSGIMTREEALKILDKPPYSDPRELEREKTTFLNTIKLSETEFDNYMNYPRKEHTDYATNDFIYKSLRLMLRVVNKLT